MNVGVFTCWTGPTKSEVSVERDATNKCACHNNSIVLEQKRGPCLVARAWFRGCFFRIWSKNTVLIVVS